MKMWRALYMTVLCNQPEAFASYLGDDQARNLLLVFLCLHIFNIIQLLVTYSKLGVALAAVEVLLYSLP